MITTDDFTKIKHDVNGNPRYVMHFIKLVSDNEVKAAENMGIEFVGWQYKQALKRSRKYGGKKFHNRQFGGGIVFGCVFNLQDLCDKLNQLLEVS